MHARAHTHLFILPVAPLDDGCSHILLLLQPAALHQHTALLPILATRGQGDIVKVWRFCVMCLVSPKRVLDDPGRFVQLSLLAVR